MPTIRLAACAILLGLSGCVAYPVPVAAPYPAYQQAPIAPQEQVSGYIGTTCFAGNYTCQVPPGPVGTQCSCPGLGAPSFGSIR